MQLKYWAWRISVIAESNLKLIRDNGCFNLFLIGMVFESSADAGEKLWYEENELHCLVKNIS